MPRANPEADSLRDLGELFDLHALSLEDILNTGQRQWTLKTSCYYHEPAGTETVQGQYRANQPVYRQGLCHQFSSRSKDPFEQIRKRLRKRSGKIRSRQADYLLYTLIDAIIDEGFPVLEEFGNSIEQLEEEILYSPDKQTPRKLHELKRELLMLSHPLAAT